MNTTEALKGHSDFKAKLIESKLFKNCALRSLEFGIRSSRIIVNRWSFVKRGTNNLSKDTSCAIRFNFWVFFNIYCMSLQGFRKTLYIG